jgi:eukaryotic-like serine/threonine-protein kinase
MTMNEETLFHEARQKPVDERTAFLDEACGGDIALRARVESLLQADDNPDSLLEPQPPATSANSSLSEAAGQVIGPYKLLQQIGEGGMGVVWMAEQTQPVQRKVALKVIKPGMDSRQVIARFEAERQALAMMDHVNIARVLDAGATDSGLPYFVMELVHGVPITKYCDDNHLTPRERLELFVPVCQAIQHAHQKGIIHRDIKPSNVMITLYDGKPVPKVIDFGVAKATEQTLTERTLFTQYGTMVGTLEYMSPEQAEMSALGVDTRSDIYSLGALLYELLTGSTPLTHKLMKEAAYAEVLRLIKEEEPPRPSTRLSDSGEALASISALRHMEPAKLTKLVRGELDWIVMKTLEKDRNRRYETASAFAADVQRYLNDEPVQACPPSAWYRFGKLARRNKAALVTASLVVAALVAGTAVATWQAVLANRAKVVAVAQQQRANQEAATAKRVTESLQQMLGLIDPDAASRSILSLSAVRLQVLLGLVRRDAQRGSDYTILQLIDDFADNLEGKLADQPAAAADLHATIGRAYACRGQPDKARKHLERALVLGRSVYGDEHERYADILVDYARPDASIGLSELTAREADLRHALAIYRARGIEGERVIRALWTLEWNLNGQGHAGAPDKWDQIEPVLHEALAEAAKTPDVEFPKIATIYSALAEVASRRAQYAEAERIARAALAMHRKSHPDSLETAWCYFTLGGALAMQGKFTEALAVQKQALTMMRNVLPPEHSSIAVLSNAVIRTLGLADKSHALAELFPAVADMGELESVFRQVLTSTKPGKLDDGDPAFVAVRSLARFSEFYLDLSRELAAAGKTKEAEESRRKGMLVFESLQTQLAGSPDLLPYVYSYGMAALTKAGQPQQAKDLCRKLLDQVTPKTSELHNNAAWFLATAEVAAHRDPALAIELAKKAVESDPKSSYYHNTLGVARYRAGDWKQAIAELEQSMSLGKSGDSNDWFFLAMAHWQLGQKQEARKWYDQAAAWMEKNQPKNDELSRFQAEAKQLLGIEKKED